MQERFQSHPYYRYLNAVRNNSEQDDLEASTLESSLAGDDQSSFEIVFDGDLQEFEKREGENQHRSRENMRDTALERKTGSVSKLNVGFAYQNHIVANSTIHKNVKTTKYLSFENEEGEGSQYTPMSNSISSKRLGSPMPPFGARRREEPPSHQAWNVTTRDSLQTPSSWEASYKRFEITSSPSHQSWKAKKQPIQSLALRNPSRDSPRTTSSSQQNSREMKFSTQRSQLPPTLPTRPNLVTQNKEKLISTNNNSGRDSWVVGDERNFPQVRQQRSNERPSSSATVLSEVGSKASVIALIHAFEKPQGNANSGLMQKSKLPQVQSKSDREETSSKQSRILTEKTVVVATNSKKIIFTGKPLNVDTRIEATPSFIKTTDKNSYEFKAHMLGTNQDIGKRETNREMQDELSGHTNNLGRELSRQLHGIETRPQAKLNHRMDQLKKRNTSEKANNEIKTHALGANQGVGKLNMNREMQEELKVHTEKLGDELNVRLQRMETRLQAKLNLRMDQFEAAIKETFNQRINEFEAKIERTIFEIHDILYEIVTRK